jgi:hypothetical protein
LFGDEAVEGLILVEGVDDVVAVAPGGRLGTVALVAVGFGIAGDVEPVPRPAFAVFGPVKQAIDDVLIGIGRLVVQEGLLLLRRRW